MSGLGMQAGISSLGRGPFTLAWKYVPVASRHQGQGDKEVVTQVSLPQLYQERTCNHIDSNFVKCSARQCCGHTLPSINHTIRAILWYRIIHQMRWRLCLSPGKQETLFAVLKNIVDSQLRGRYIIQFNSSVGFDFGVEHVPVLSQWIYGSF